MFKIYKLELDASTETVGAYPQFRANWAQLVDHQDVRFDQLPPWWEPMPEKVSFADYIMERGAKFSDFMGTHNGYLVFNERMLNLFKDAVVVNPYLYPVQLVSKKEKREYYFVHLHDRIDENDAIDFSKSVFFQHNNNGHFRHYKLLDSEDLKLKGGNPEKLYTFWDTPPADVFIFRYLNSIHYFVSEHFRSELIKHQITGVKFEELRLYQNGE